MNWRHRSRREIQKCPTPIRLSTPAGDLQAGSYEPHPELEAQLAIE
jgi:hypothetical protein